MREFRLNISDVESHILELTENLVNFYDFAPEEIFVSNFARRTVETVLDLSCTLVVSSLGIFANIFVIGIFVKLGFKDNASVSMTVIAVWDLLKCASAVLQRMSGPIALVSVAVAESWSNISLVTFTYLVSFSCYVTCILAAYLAVERCLCSVVPLKIKWLITPERSLVVCLLISFIVFAGISLCSAFTEGGGGKPSCGSTSQRTKNMSQCIGLTLSPPTTRCCLITTTRRALCGHWAV